MYGIFLFMLEMHTWFFFARTQDFIHLLMPIVHLTHKKEAIKCFAILVSAESS